MVGARAVLHVPLGLEAVGLVLDSDQPHFKTEELRSIFNVGFFGIFVSANV
jgi:hypothetical protein